jgi:deoxyxylulose-5-phosphate synthase
MEAFSTAGLAKEVSCIGVPDEFLPFGSPSDLHESVGMDAPGVVSRVLALLA